MPRALQTLQERAVPVGITLQVTPASLQDRPLCMLSLILVGVVVRAVITAQEVLV